MQSFCIGGDDDILVFISRLRGQVPDIKKCLEMLEFLQANKVH